MDAQMAALAAQVDDVFADARVLVLPGDPVVPVILAPYEPGALRSLAVANGVGPRDVD
jgi:hypothetical protein